MIELLILFELNRTVLTMYGVSKSIRTDFSVLTTPSYGTIKPALTRLEANGFVVSQKSISKGGRPSAYYSITKDGINELKRLLAEEPPANPIQFLPMARVKLACADVLSGTDELIMLKALKSRAQRILFDTENLVNSKDLSFYPKMVFDNLICEYKNFISLLEAFERTCSQA